MIATLNHTDRQTRLHSTDVSAILGLNPKRDGHTVFLEKGGRLEPWKGSDATEMGNWLEPSVLNIAESELGPLSRNVACHNDEHDCPFAATLDAQMIGGLSPVEAKTSGIVGPVYGDWGPEGTDFVPQQYLVQASVQMLCSGADMVHLYALLGGRGIVRYRIVRDEELISAIAVQCSKWWQRHICEGIEPEKVQPPSLEVAKRLRRTANKTVSLDESATEVFERWESAKAAKRDAEKACDTAQAELLMLMADAEAATLTNGKSLTYFEQSRRAYQVDECSFRVLRAKKG